MKIFILFVCLFSFILAKVEYKNHKLYSVTPTQVEIDSLIKEFSQDPLDIWTYDGVLVPNQPNDILVSPLQVSKFESIFTSKNFRITNQNIQDSIDNEERLINSKNNTFFTKYHRYQEIHNFIKGLEEKYPEHAKVFELGKTFENRPIYGLKAFQDQKSIEKKGYIWVSSLQHAREWIAPPVNLYLMERLLKEFKAGEQRVKKLFEKYNFVFLPVLNIDGYEYTHTNARLWRKNRRSNSPHSSIGVDLNRNWPFQWGGRGASRDPSSDVYMGPSAGSEKEVQNVMKFFQENKLAAAIDIHSYSQLLLRPWQYTEAPCPDEKDLQELGQKMVNAIKRNGNQDYRNIRGSQLYVHSGAMVDYFYGQNKLYGYTVELRPSPSSPYGFVLPPQFILPTVTENYFALLEFFEYEH